MFATTVAYNSTFFNSRIFKADYQTIAENIVEIYQPKTVADFGCGPGYLSKELAKLGVKVTAVDGYARPDFSGLAVEFHTLDLNDRAAIENLFRGRSFDLAISLEVAEHLNPAASSPLVNCLTTVAPVVVFSAAVPGQGGHGHINLQPREYWHREFTKCGFVCADRLREKLRASSHVAPWYRYNILDYVRSGHPLAPEPTEVIERLIASESASTTAYFTEYDHPHIADPPIKLYLAARQLVKKIIRRNA